MASNGKWVTEELMWTENVNDITFSLITLNYITFSTKIASISR